MGALLLGLALTSTCQAARRDYHFATLGSAEGLLQNTVHALLQDRTGYVWIGTQGGLQRYDGYGFLDLMHDPARGDTLPESFVTALAEGADGRLWAGTFSRFVAAIDIQSGKVERAHPGELDVEPVERNRVVAIAAAADGTLWVATVAGVERYHPDSGERKELLRYEGPPSSRWMGLVRTTAMTFDRDGMLWVGSDQGLFRIAADSGRVLRVAETSRIHALHRDRKGSLWLAGDAGLFELNGGRPRPLNSADGAAMPAIRQVASDPQGRLWLALKDGGLMRFDPAERSSLSIMHRRDIPQGLHEPRIASLMVDSGGLLWVGGESRGLATAPSAGSRFALLMDTETRRGGRLDNSVRTLLAADRDHVWVGTDSGGLKRVRLDDGAIEDHGAALLAALPAAARDPGVLVAGLAAGDQGRLWVSSDAGLFEFEPHTGRARRLQAEPWRAAGPVADSYRSILRSRDGSLWIGTYDTGLIHFQSRDGSHRRYRHDPARTDSLGHGLINCLLEDRAGTIWVGTLGGLSRIDPATGRVRRFRHDPVEPDSLSGDIVRALWEDRDGGLWVATHGGLSRLLEVDAEQARFKRYGATEGLPSATLYGVLQAADGAIWTSGNRGLARLDPATDRFRSHQLDEGLQDLEYNGGAQLALDDGRLLFGGINGLTLFDPARIAPSRFAPAVVLSGWRYFNGRTSGAFRGGARIDLPADTHLLRLTFAVLDFEAPRFNRYQYLLEGFDAGWIDNGTANEATYTHITPGRYTLRVRGSNRDGIWSSQELVVPVSVEAAWWARNETRLAALALLTVLVLLAGRQIQRVRRQERRLLLQISEREERLKLALWGSGDEFWDWDIQANTLHRIGVEQLLGGGGADQLSTDDWRDRSVHPDDLPRVQWLMQQHLSGKAPAYESEHRLRNAQGGWTWVRARGKVVARDAEGHPLRIAGTARDVTTNRQAEGERRVASEVLRSMGEAVAVVDLDYRFVSVNPAFSRITGYSAEEVIGQPSSILDSNQQGPEFYQRLRETVDRIGHWKGELWQQRKDGEEFLGWIELSEVRDDNGQRTHFVAVVTDITDKKRAEQELRYLANFDTLTGLPNRTLLAERLARAVVRARRQENRVGVLFIDLDRFKDINDSLGHAAGDRILKAAGARLQATVRETDTVARLGGDEFTVVLEDLHSAHDAEEMARRIITAFAAPLELDGRAEIPISPSVGIALYPDHGLVPTDLLKFADTAMYQAKERGRNTWQLYTEEMDAETRRRASMLSALRKALDRGEFQLVFQPRLSLLDDRITGAEALLRWHSEELGTVEPTTFIPLAEETGLIVAIGEWALREAAMTLARWRHAGLDELVMAVNVSVLQFLRHNLAEEVAQVLEETGVPANRLELEVTESMVMANAEQAIRVMRELKNLGLSLAIDDFGTGYSSLIYLKRLPIDTLKIDKEFIGDLTTDPDDEAITATIISMAHSLGLNVVAEGAETDEQVAYLREQRCDEIQGYWLARPMDGHHCLAFIRSWQRRTVGQAAE